MVSASDFTSGKVPLSGNTIGTDNILQYVVGTVMILGAVKGGAFIVNRLQQATGVSQDETQVRVV